MSLYKVKLQCRKDTETNWINNDPTLLNGEFGIATKTEGLKQVFKGMKIGEGLSWNNTAYLPVQSLNDIVQTVFNSIQDSQTVEVSYDANTAKYQLDVISQPTMKFDGTGIKVPSVDAVNNQALKGFQVSIHTGFLRTDDTFSLGKIDEFTLGVDASQYGIAFPGYFKSAGTAPEDAIKFLTYRTIPLSDIANYYDIPDNSNTILFVGWAMPGDMIVFSRTDFIQSDNIAQLGIVFVKKVNGVWSFTDPNRDVITMPDISAYSALLTTTTGITSTVVINPVPGTMAMRHYGGIIQGMSVGWGTSNNDEIQVFNSANPMIFTFRHPESHPSPTIPYSTYLDPTNYWNGTNVVPVPQNNNATVMRVMISVRGQPIIQMGETVYTTLAIAKENAYQQVFTPVLAKYQYTEIGRIAVTKSANDLADITDASFFVTGSGGGGGSSASTTFNAIGGSPYDNVLLSAELQRITTDVSPGQQVLLSNPANWSTPTNSSASYYIGATALNGNIQGQFYFDGLYQYFFIADDYPIRLVGSINSNIIPAGSIPATALDTATTNKLKVANLEDYTLRVDPDIKTTSQPVPIKGLVNSVTVIYSEDNGGSIPPSNFTYNYREMYTGPWTTGVDFNTLSTALINSTQEDRVVWVSATNTITTVPTAAILTVKRYA